MIEIEGEIEASIFESYFTKALKHLGEHVELDGFRKGKAPESVLVSKIPEIKILEEMAEHALEEFYPKMLVEEKIDAMLQAKKSLASDIIGEPGVAILTEMSDSELLAMVRLDIHSALTEKET